MRRTSALCCAFLLSLSMAMTGWAQSKNSATLQGKVFTDTTLKPIVGVEVLLPELSKTTTSDAKGAFRIVDIPPGTYTVQARHVGFVPFESRVEFRKGQTAERPIIMPHFTLLDSVRVVGEVSLPLSFFEHRALGLGYFLTRADLEKQGNIRMPSVLAQVPGLGMVNGRSTQGWVMSKRYVTPIDRTLPNRPKPTRAEMYGQDSYVPDEGEKRMGIVPGCYARVYLDNTLLNSTSPAEPVDVNQFLTSSVQAIEYFSGSSQTPSQYSRLNSNCGVLVIHTLKNH
ncbi:MAG: carboxypeptidase-like regulatory domain-containing protein [Gemmatimonadaceae bacterium]